MDDKLVTQPMNFNSPRMPPAPFGLTFLAEIANDARIRRHDSFAAVEAAITRHIEALGQRIAAQEQLLVHHERARGRLDALPLLRAEGTREVESEVSHRDAQRRKVALRDDLEILELERQLAIARGELTVSPEHEPVPDPESPLQAAIRAAHAEAMEVQRTIDAYIDEIVQAAGGEEHLSSSQAGHIDALRELRDSKIALIFEGLR